MREAVQGKNSVTVNDVRDFNTDHIFDCGQCFRWEREEDGSWTGTAFGRTVNIKYEKGLLTIDNASVKDFHEIWEGYLDLGRDYGGIKKTLVDGDPAMERAVDFGSGIRILRQDPWETTVSFIISQNSNIPRIKKCIEKLCELFGEPIGEYRGRQRYSFPGPERLAGLSREDLAPVRLGYRDKYIMKTSQAVASDGGAGLAEAAAAPGPDAEKYLRSLTGIGPKVAGCILLFGMNKYGSFPIDVWMKKIMAAMYGFEESDLKGMSAYAREHFGSLSGFAQQYLYYYARFNL